MSRARTAILSTPMPVSTWGQDMETFGYLPLVSREWRNGSNTVDGQNPA